MSKSDSAASKRERNKTIRWVFSIFIITVIISGTISFVSDYIMQSSTIVVAFLILLIIVLLGIVFDIVGVAVTSADEKPFHSMAARKVPGSQESIALLRNAERVSSICNDVVGDICGVVSGAASATIALQILNMMPLSSEQVISLLMSAFVAGLTVGGKAIGKTMAIKSCTEIVTAVGKFIFFINSIPTIFKKKNNS